MMAKKHSKVRIRKLVLFLVLIYASSCVQSGRNHSATNPDSSSEKIREKIVELENKLIRAYLDNDIAVLNELYHDELIFNSPDGRILKKEDDIESLKSGTLKIVEYKPENYIINIKENTAYVSVSIHLKAQIIGGEFERDFLFMRAWQQFDDGWKLMAISGFLKPGG